MKDLRDIEVIPWRPRRDLVEIRAALRLVERGLHPERFKLFGQSHRWRLEFELRQMKINVARLEFCASGQHVAGQLRFESVQTLYVVGEKNEELEIIPDVGEAHSGKSFALRVAEMFIGLPHHRYIYR